MYAQDATRSVIASTWNRSAAVRIGGRAARVRYLTDDEQTRLRKALRDEHWPKVVVALHTGGFSTESGNGGGLDRTADLGIMRPSL